MPRAPRPWFRFYVEAVYDRKLRRLTPTQRWLWVAMLAAARQSPVPGRLLVSECDAMDVTDVADVAAVPPREVRRALPLFEAAGMLERDGDCWVVRRWSERQYESDDVTRRTRKQRAKEHDRNVPTSPKRRSNERGRNVPTGTVGTPPETETETETEVEPSNEGSSGELARRRKRDVVFDALVEVFGPASTKTRVGLYAKCAHELRAAGATAEDVVERGRRMLAKDWSDATPVALTKHWDALGIPANGGQPVRPAVTEWS